MVVVDVVDGVLVVVLLMYLDRTTGAGVDVMAFIGEETREEKGVVTYAVLEYLGLLL